MELKKSKNTICYKISHCLDEAQKALTGTFDLLSLVTNLHLIRNDAQKMEEALKLRKQLMIKHSIEDEYQLAKDKNYTPKGINNIPLEEQRVYNSLKYHIILTDKNNNNKILYENNVASGLFCIVENITDIDEEGIITGTTQRFSFGHELSVWFAFTQLENALEAKFFRTVIALKRSVMKKDFNNPEKRKEILDLMNNNI